MKAVKVNVVDADKVTVSLRDSDELRVVVKDTIDVSERV